MAKDYLNMWQYSDEIKENHGVTDFEQVTSGMKL
jgi:hypothetical protein